MMLTLIKNAEIYSPSPLGRKDLLIAGSKVLAIEDEIRLNTNAPCTTVDAAGYILTPGFVDSLVHVTGGGGEGGFATRTPEMPFSDAPLAGVTTLIGALGTDATTRSMSNLLAKVNELTQLGITAYCYTGSYQYPVKTLLGSVQDDILLLQQVIGVGEVAIADHRASHMTVQEIIRLASEARVGGMLAGKSGIVSIHLGDSPEGLSLLKQATAQSSIPASQFYPTHINRNPELLTEGFGWAKQGGYIDFTCSTTPQILAAGETSAAEALAKALASKVPASQISFSSDGNASLPLFDGTGKLLNLQVAKVNSLHQSLCEAVNQHKIALEQVLPCLTLNPAQILKLNGKGVIACQQEADLLLMDKQTLAIRHVWAKGALLVEDGKALVRGNFE